MKKVYHADVKVEDLNIRLYFPTAQLRKMFCMMNAELEIRSGRRPLAMTMGDLNRTRMNLEFYSELRNFVPIWDAVVK